MRDRGRDVGECAVTVRVMTLKGPEAGSYYVEALGSYYLDGDEPPGRWRGAGAEALGLTGTLDDDDFLALMAGLDPGSGTDLGTHHTGRTVRGLDVTCSAPKSLSVLFAVGDEHTRREALAAHDAAVEVVVDWIERHGHCRHRVNGQIWTVDAHGIAAALFRQHTSRELDPQVHTHIVIPNRVLAPDGRWLALDARTIKRDQRTLSAIYHAGLRAELTARLGVRWHEPVDGIAEMADLDPAVLAAYSTRTRAVQGVLDHKIDRFAESYGRDPTPRERWRLEREAVIESRPTKASADALELHQEWRARLTGLGTDPQRLVRGIVERVRSVEPDLFTAPAIEREAVDALSAQQSTWRAAEIDREVARAVPTTLPATAAEVVAWVEELSAEVERDLVVDLSPAGPTPSLAPDLRPGLAPDPVAGPGPAHGRAACPAGSPVPVPGRADGLAADPVPIPGQVDGPAGGHASAQGSVPGPLPDHGSVPVPVPGPAEGPVSVPVAVPLRRDGRPVTEAAVDRILTTAEVLAQEDRIVSRAQARLEQLAEDHHDLADYDDLTGVQHEVAAAVAGTRELTLVVGPAGTGKTTALAPAVEQLRRDGRVVFGV
ncbi:MAG: conjugal transfer protein (TraA-like protein), partial [Acidimicrobiales bacterium]|nr:conjugal transfer protein (TraA-like protein) [Acidimicrobiales bacterium]